MSTIKLSIIVLLLVGISITSCKNRPVFDSAPNDIDSVISIKDSLSNDSTFISFRFLNNPYNFNHNHIIEIYTNYTLVYRGKYEPYLELKGSPHTIFSTEDRLIIILCVIDKKRKTREQFQTKKVFYWNDNYTVIYCCFFPSNRDVEEEEIAFIPHTDDIL